MNRETDSTQELLDYLASVQTGTISDTMELESLLAACWGMLIGGGAEGMTSSKLFGRMEDITWDPPILSFVIERHGATALGSTRADLHRWEVNLESRFATCIQDGYRQVYARQPRLDVRPLAEEVAQLIINRQHDERLKWNDDGSVRVHAGKIIPAAGVAKQTLTGRRKRLRKATKELLATAGWQEVRANVYAPSDTCNGGGQ
jgi:hypothetical protein